MDYKKQALQIARAFIKYRKEQEKLVKMRSRPAHTKNVQPVTDQLRKINYHLADMDKMANEIVNPKKEV